MNLRRSISCMLACAMLLTALTIPAAANFSDVPEGHKAAADIEEVVSLGLMQGESRDSFGFGKLMTRAEFVQSLCRFFEWNLNNPAQGSYQDNQDPNAWYYRVVETAYAHGVITSQSDKFYPEAPISREDMAVMLIRAMGFGTLAGRAQEFRIPFRDVQSNAGYIAMAYEMGLMQGTSATEFSPEETVTREQAAVILMRLYRSCRQASIGRTGILSTDQVRDLNGYDAVGIAAQKLIFAGELRLVNSIREEVAASIYEKTQEAAVPALLYITGPTTTVLESDPEATADLLANAVYEGGYDGLFLDLPEVKGNQSDLYLTLAQALRAALQEKTLYLMTEAPSWNGPTYSGYDYTELGKCTDRIVLRVTSYEQFTDGFPVSPQEPLEEVYYALSTLRKWTENEKLSLYLTTTGVSWLNEQYQGSLPSTQIQELRESIFTEEYYSARYGCAYLIDSSGQDDRVVWYLNDGALNQRLWLAAFFGVDQICFSDLSSIAGYDGYSLLEQ